MPSKRLGARHWRDVLTKNTHKRLTFGAVIIGRASTVCIDIVYFNRLQSRHRQCFFHCLASSCSLVRGGRLVKSITSISIALNGETLRKRISAFITSCHHHKSRTFSQIESCPRIIKRPTAVFVKNHQRVKPI